MSTLTLIARVVAMTVVFTQLKPGYWRTVLVGACMIALDALSYYEGMCA